MISNSKLRIEDINTSENIANSKKFAGIEQKRKEMLNEKSTFEDSRESASSNFNIKESTQTSDQIYAPANEIEFDLQLTGGPKHTDLLVASAVLKNGNATIIIESGWMSFVIS